MGHACTHSFAAAPHRWTRVGGSLPARLPVWGVTLQPLLGPSSSCPWRNGQRVRVGKQPPAAGPPAVASPVPGHTAVSRELTTWHFHRRLTAPACAPRPERRRLLGSVPTTGLAPVRAPQGPVAALRGGTAVSPFYRAGNRGQGRGSRPPTQSHRAGARRGGGVR